jgi:hypothetical protein
MTTSKSELQRADWEHRLQVLWAWRHCRGIDSSDRDQGAIYRAVLDGCAITIRSLCNLLGVGCNFQNLTICEGSERVKELFKGCSTGEGRIEALSLEERRCLLEVLYLANRAVAHPKDGKIDHKAGGCEMTVAINVVLSWLRQVPRGCERLSEVDQRLLDAFD